METEIAHVSVEHHHGSHRKLVDAPGDAFVPATPGRVDAIVVPTIRHPRWLKYAICLASELNCRLVSLHSGNYSSAGEAAARMPDDVDFLAVDLGQAKLLNLPDFRTTALLKGTSFARKTDLSAKRNLGLMLARLMKWERIVFLDDDIEVGGHEEVVRAAALLDDYDAVGMHIGGFPDNSVVCHAHRLAGGRQDSFVGGGAMAIETTRRRSFFPNVYNEDWFYLLGETSLSRLAVTGMVRQRPYDPFDRPLRARDQELGDVLAEGVYWLLDERASGGWQAATEPAHWAGFLAKRKEFIQDVLDRVRELPPSYGARTRMEESLIAARGRHDLITPALCVAFLDAWTRDRDVWARHFETLPELGAATADAMKWLTKDGVRPLRYWTPGNTPR
ncbi:hypothetical protein SAMN05444920_103226 [Nonomuraea solani]|uniref:Glycosyl transferase family 2 n=1 Tax=Nonomuraea solani TaxID=1144553 RepID=A0A1H6B8G1_9ACTN|nr:hypothetical protein [Nonomuraea solani]SEG57088.1 hypothetical protein SAMN05444920_103226 [Nonomuraea solani]